MEGGKRRGREVVQLSLSQSTRPPTAFPSICHFEDEHSPSRVILPNLQQPDASLSFIQRKDRKKLLEINFCLQSHTAPCLWGGVMTWRTTAVTHRVIRAPSRSLLGFLKLLNTLQESVRVSRYDVDLLVIACFDELLGFFKDFRYRAIQPAYNTPSKLP